MSAAQLAALARTTGPRITLRRFLALDAVVTGANGLHESRAASPTSDAAALPVAR